MSRLADDIAAGKEAILDKAIRQAKRLGLDPSILEWRCQQGGFHAWELWHGEHPVLVREDTLRSGEPVLNTEVLADYPNSEKRSVVDRLISIRLERISNG